MEWHAIDTAPKDGTRIFLYMPDASKYGYKTRQIGYWFQDTCWSCENRRIYPATHWMPLPKPPTNED